jgi:putative endonuclease
MSKSYFVYIMSSLSRTLYTGVTNNLERRAYEHKTGALDGFTKRYKINRLAYYQETNDIGAAIAAEKQIKAMTRAKKIALIEQENPSWDDLSAESSEERVSSLRSE